MAKRYDVVVLGVGNAGMGAAGVARAGGLSVAMVDYQDPGGTCPLRGCVPKKVLVAAAQVLHQIALAEQHHIAVGPAQLDWPALIARERTFVEGVPQMFADSLTSRGIDLFRARAKFVGDHRVQVGDEVLEGGKIVIATGSKPRPLPIPGAEHFIVSDDILESPELPASIVFIGGGVIALEFAHVYARAGSQVTILEALPRLLPRIDQDAVAQVHKESERIGIEVLTGVKVESVAPAEGGLEVRFQHDGQNQTRRAARVANGTGRIADLEDLDLAAGGIEHEGLRIAVDGHLASASNPDVYLAGDALWSSPQLSPVASYEGRLVGEKHSERQHAHAGLPADPFGGLHRAGPGHGRSDRGGGPRAGLRGRGQGQRPDRLALVAHLRRNRRLLQDPDRGRQRDDPGRPPDRPRRRGVDPHIRLGDQDRSERGRSGRAGAGLSDLHLRYQEYDGVGCRGCGLEQAPAGTRQAGIRIAVPEIVANQGARQGAHHSLRLSSPKLEASIVSGTSSYAAKLPLWVVIGALLGAFTGVFFGDDAAVLRPIGTVYVKLMEVTHISFVESYLDKTTLWPPDESGDLLVRVRWGKPYGKSKMVSCHTSFEWDDYPDEIERLL